jgi:transporter family protein
MAILAKLRVKWFWCSVLTVLAWAAWAICAKIGSNELSVNAMQFFFSIGAAPLAVLLLIKQHFTLERDSRGIIYGVTNGLLSSVGNLALLAAFRSGGNTAVIAAATSLYPMITVALAILFLRERLTKRQLLGIGFAAAAIVIFSL